MSAAIVVFPQTTLAPRLVERGALAAASVELRKGPHTLRLVQACEDPRLAPQPAAQPAAQPTAPVRRELPRQTRTADATLAFYRKYTEGMLRRYSTLSMESGRVPSLLGRELFRGRVTHYDVQGFDDVVIFVHDMGKCLALLDPALRHVVRRVAIEGYTQAETAALVGLSLRTVVVKYADALDRLTRILLDRGLLEPVMASDQA